MELRLRLWSTRSTASPSTRRAVTPSTWTCMPGGCGTARAARWARRSRPWNGRSPSPPPSRRRPRCRPTCQRPTGCGSGDGGAASMETQRRAAREPSRSSRPSQCMVPLARTALRGLHRPARIVPAGRSEPVTAVQAGGSQRLARGLEPFPPHAVLPAAMLLMAKCARRIEDTVQARDHYR